MIDYLNDIIYLGKYIVSIIGLLGILLLVVGLLKGQRQFITRGGYLILLALVLGICGYLIYKTTLERADDMIYNYIENSGNSNY